jgi:P pilus assembly chaperone PapD
MTPLRLRAACLAALHAAALTVLGGAHALLHAQGVLVAPQAVFIDHRTRSGSIELYNPGPDPVEVSVSAVFGYPVTDSLGTTTLYTADDPGASAPSAASWISAYPRRTKLVPGQRQTVRLLARPPENLADGEYWTRLVIAAKGGRVELDGGADSTGIRVGLDLEVRTVIALLYRKGPVRTAVALSNVQTRIEGDSLAVRARLAREGNAAYLGMVHGALLDSGGRAAATFAVPTAVYYSLEPRYTLPIAGLPPGRYTLQLSVGTEREDITGPALVTSPPVRDSVPVLLPARGGR